MSGNYPQAFSHVGVINAALAIAAAEAGEPSLPAGEQPAERDG